MTDDHQPCGCLTNSANTHREGCDMGNFSRSNEGCGLGSGQDLEEHTVRGTRRNITVTRGRGVSEAQFRADIKTAERHANQ